MAAFLLTPQARAAVDRFKGAMKSVTTLDWGAINQRCPDWNIRWRKTIGR